MQHCVRELFLWSARYDVELGRGTQAGGGSWSGRDALSRMFDSRTHRELVERDEFLAAAERVYVPARHFELVSEL